MNSIWRNGVALLADQRADAADELSTQPTENRGVVSALASAEILRAAAFDTLSQLCARRGLRRLSLESFNDDCDEVLSEHGFVSKSLLQMMSAVGQLNADDTKALAGLLTRLGVLDAPQVATFEQCVAALRTDSETPSAQAATKAMNIFWTAGLSDWIEERLEYLTQPSEQPAAVAGYAKRGFVAPPSGYGAPLPRYQPTVEREVPIELSGPDGLMLVPEMPSDSKRETRRLHLPFTIPLPTEASRLKITGVAGHENEPLYVWLKPSPAAADMKLATFGHMALPLAFEQNDLLAALKGETIISKVYLEFRGLDSTFKTLSSRGTENGESQLEEGSTRGECLLTVCITKDDSLAPRTLITERPNSKAPNTNR